MNSPSPRAPRSGIPVVPAVKPRMHGKDRRAQLLEVAVEVFARQGFGGTKTKDIAAAAGVSEAILFRHFASKEDLYHAILDAKEDKHGAPEFLEALRTFADRRDDAGLFQCVASVVVTSFREDPAFHRLMVYASLEGHLLAGLFHERFGVPISDYLRRYMALRQKEGAFRKGDPQIAVMFVLGSIVHFAMVRHVFQFRKPNVAEDAAVREMVKMALAGLIEPSGARLVKKGKKRPERMRHA
jgi:TetR/AcrR family transcriptional regulator